MALTGFYVRHKISLYSHDTAINLKILAILLILKCQLLRLPTRNAFCHDIIAEILLK